MPAFEPFRALRYRPELLQLVTSPPYDVLSPAERDAYASMHPENIVHVDLPLESDGPTRYEAAASLLGRWRSSGVLSLDSSPTLTIYRMTFHDDRGLPRTTLGVIGALEVVDENAGGVLPHERTTPKAKTDRLDLTRATRCNLSPVWGLSLGAGLTAALTEPAEPIGTVVIQGVQHDFERVTDSERIHHISQLISAKDVVIADGHHRYAISRTYRDEARAAHSPVSHAASTTMTYVSELIEDQLSVAAIHRLYSIPDDTCFEEAISAHFDRLPCASPTDELTAWMEQNGCLMLLRSGTQPVALRPRAEVFAGIRNLDGSRLEHALRNCPHEVRYQHGVSEVRRIVDSGEADAAILIRPVTVEEIRRTARERELMPPKSTFFTPKLLTGAVLRPLDA